MSWLNNGKTTKSEAEVTNFIHDAILSGDFNKDDLVGFCQGFTGRTPARVRDGSLPKGLTESPVQLPCLGRLRTRVGSKSLVMQDYK